jgi:hypothetical protein
VLTRGAPAFGGVFGAPWASSERGAASSTFIPCETLSLCCDAGGRLMAGSGRWDGLLARQPIASSTVEQAINVRHFTGRSPFVARNPARRVARKKAL